MRVKILNESGYTVALFGLGLSCGITSGMSYDNFSYPNKEKMDKMKQVAQNLCSKNNGENKFLESIQVWLDVTASRMFWQQEATYRIGITRQSESTMKTLLKNELTTNDFNCELDKDILNKLNMAIKAKDFLFVKNHLPESFLQRRIISTNYKTIRNILYQRKNHKLQEWRDFCKFLIKNLDCPEFLEV